MDITRKKKESIRKEEVKSDGAGEKERERERERERKTHTHTDRERERQKDGERANVLREIKRKKMKEIRSLGYRERIY